MAVPRSHVFADPTLIYVAARARERIRAQGSKPHTTVAEQLEALEGLLTFELGRFLLQNKGFNGFWTEYVCTWPQRGADRCPPAERELLELPGLVATRERHARFQAEIHRRLEEGCVFASIPCGLMDDLLEPASRSSLSSFKLVGIDLDPEALFQARAKALTLGLFHHTEFRHQDAWALQEVDAFDLISSNGLNVYVLEDARVEELYRRFHAALKPGGTLVTSTLTPAPDESAESTWDMSVLTPETLRRQLVLLGDVIQGRFTWRRSAERVCAQLRAAGFSRVEVFPERRGMWPTLVAVK
jgi:SAM-dependent methyltransferase